MAKKPTSNPSAPTRDPVVAHAGIALRAALERALTQHRESICNHLDEELATLTSLVANANRVRGVVDSATTPADFVQVGEMVVQHRENRDSGSLLTIDGLSIGITRDMGYGRWSNTCTLSPFASGIAVSEVVRAMSGAGEGLRDGKRYRVLVMAWEVKGEEGNGGRR